MTGFSIFSNMNTIDFEEYIQDNFNVSSPDELSDHDKIIAYERMKAEYMFLELSNDEYLKTCMKVAEYLGV